MSATAQNLNLSAPPIVSVWRRRFFAIGVIFSAIAIGLAFMQPDKFFHAYLVSYMQWLGLALGSMAILMLRHLTKGGWGMIIRRMLGAAMRMIPFMTLLFLPIAFVGMKYLYNAWLDPEKIAKSEHLQHLTASYLNVPGFLLRAVIYFALWNLISFLLSKWSRQQNNPPLRDNSQRFKALSGPGILIYGLTLTFAVIDWVMSIDPTWISTIYGLIFLIGQLVSAMTFAIIVERVLFDYEPMSVLLQKEYVHDHGKFTLAFIMVWAYFSFSQWLIIWSGNLPEEITWYMRRLSGGWQFVGLFLVLFFFAVPFVFLLSRSFKRDVRRLVYLAAWLFLMRYVDLFWIIRPNYSATFNVTLSDIVVPLAMGGLWLSLFCRNLSSQPLVPAYDAYAVEVLEPHHE